MLTKEQAEKLRTMMINYEQKMIDTHKASYSLIEAWTERYGIAMEQVLQTQYKH